MVDMVWQVQDAKQRFSELLRRVESEGPQIVSRHGREIAVVMNIEKYHELVQPKAGKDLNWLLVNGPKIDLPDEEFDALFERSREPETRETPFADWA